MIKRIIFNILNWVKLNRIILIIVGIVLFLSFIYYQSVYTPYQKVIKSYPDTKTYQTKVDSLLKVNFNLEEKLHKLYKDKEVLQYKKLRNSFKNEVIEDKYKEKTSIIKKLNVSDLKYNINKNYNNIPNKDEKQNIIISDTTARLILIQEEERNKLRNINVNLIEKSNILLKEITIKDSVIIIKNKQLDNAMNALSIRDKQVKEQNDAFINLSKKYKRETIKNTIWKTTTIFIATLLTVAAIKN